MTDELVAFLARAAREFHGWVFTGFHWPVLAGQVAALLDGSCRQLFEAGFATEGPAEALPTSTTDYAAFGTAVRWRGSTADVLGALVARADRVVLDAANVDLRGRLNSIAVGGYARPRVRLPGGGGAADAAFAARELVLLHGGADPARIVSRVEHVTAAPGPDAVVRLLTRWGTVRLGPEPRLLSVTADAAPLVDRLRALGVETAEAVPEPLPSERALTVARDVVAQAAQRGYLVAREARRA